MSGRGNKKQSRINSDKKWKSTTVSRQVFNPDIQTENERIKQYSRE